MKHRKVSRGRRVSIGKGIRNRNGSGNSKFKTRHRKMRGGAGSVQVYDCKDDDSHVGGPYANYLDMHAAESEINPKSKFIKGRNGTVNTLYAGKTMRMGIVNIRSGFKELFAPQIKHLRGIGLTQVLFTNPTNCRTHNACKAPFYTSDHKVIHVNTRYVFFGKLSDKGVKNGWGVCYDVSDPNRGRIFIGYWMNGFMNGLGIEVDFEYDVSSGSRPVGVYYGNFLGGRRHGYGKYRKGDNNEATLFQTTENGRCLLLHKSFETITPDDEKERLKKSFSTQCKASLFMPTDLNRRPLGIKEYMKIFLRDVESSISDTLVTITNTYGNGSDEEATFSDYMVIYNAFVSDCGDILNKALAAYKQTKHKDKFAQEQQAEEKAAQQIQAQLLKAKGIITGDILDPDKEEAKRKGIDDCKVLLEAAGYDLKSPEQKAKENEDQQKANLEKIPELVNVKRQHDELTGRLKFAKELELSPFPRRRTRMKRSSSSSDDNTPHSRGFFSVLSNTPSPTTPSQRELSFGTRNPETPMRLVSAYSGGNLTRKNRRTGKRGMRRKSRRHRRHHRHHHHRY